MNIDTLLDFIPMVSSLLVLTTFFVYVYIKTPSSYKLKLLGIPLVLMFSLFTITTMDKMLGTSIKRDLPEDFILISYHVIKKKGEPYIEIWIKKDEKTKLYRVDYNRKLENQLSMALKRKAKLGIPQKGEWKKRGGENDDGPTFYDFPHRKVYPKQENS